MMTDRHDDVTPATPVIDSLANCMAVQWPYADDGGPVVLLGEEGVYIDAGRRPTSNELDALAEELRRGGHDTLVEVLATWRVTA